MPHPTSRPVYLTAAILVAAIDPVQGGHGLPAAATPVAAQPATATAEITCAPNDGPAVALFIPHSARTVLQVTLWGGSIDRLRRGSLHVTIDDPMVSDDRGHAALCPRSGGSATDPCRSVSGVVLDLDVAGFRVGDALKGRVRYRDDTGAPQTRAIATRIAVPREGGPICGFLAGGRARSTWPTRRATEP